MRLNILTIPKEGKIFKLTIYIQSKIKFTTARRKTDGWIN